MLEWLTLWPTSGALAVRSQRRDIKQIPIRARGAAVGRPFHGVGDRGRIVRGQKGVKARQFCYLAGPYYYMPITETTYSGRTSKRPGSFGRNALQASSQIQAL